MTCIAAINNDNYIWLGADKLISIGNKKINYKDSKIWSYKEFVFGCSGLGKVCQVCKYKFKPPMIDEEYDDNIDLYINTIFIDELREVLLVNDCLKIEDGLIDNCSEIIVGIRGKMFVIYSDLGIFEINEKYTALGSGADFALGSLATTAHNASMYTEVERLKLAIDISTKFNCFVGSGFDFIITPKDAKVEGIYGK